MSRGKKQYKFTDKVQATGGVVSVVFAILALLSCGLGVWISFMTGGAAGAIIGLMGVFAIWFSGMGLYHGTKSFKQEECFYMYSWIGTISNAVILVFMGCIFMIGL